MTRIDAPSDGTTTPVAPGDFVRVLRSTDGRRADLLLDSPLDLDVSQLGPANAVFLKQYGGPGYPQGPTLRWRKDAHPAYLDLSGSSGPSGFDFTGTNAETLGWDVNGVQVDVVLDDDYLAAAEGDEQVAAWFVLADMLSQLPDVDIASPYVDPRDDSEHDFVLVTILHGETANIDLVSVPEGSKTGAAATAGIDGATIDWGIEGVFGSGGAHTHAWPDSIEPYGQRATVYPDVLRIDGEVVDCGWYALDYPVRGSDLYVQDWTQPDHPSEQLNIVVRHLADLIGVGS